MAPWPDWLLNLCLAIGMCELGEPPKKAVPAAAHLVADATAATGVGTGSCADFANHFRGDPQSTELAYGSWAQGFYAGLNMNRDDGKYRNIAWLPFKDQFSGIRHYCDEHPLANFIEPLIYGFYSLPEVAIKSDEKQPAK